MPRCIPEIQSIVLFGSVARGQAIPRSDIDVLVLLPNYQEDRFKKLMNSVDQLASEVSGRHPAKLVPVVMMTKDFEQSLKDKKRFATDVLKDGIVLFGEDWLRDPRACGRSMRYFERPRVSLIKRLPERIARENVLGHLKKAYHNLDLANKVFEMHDGELKLN